MSKSKHLLRFSLVFSLIYCLAACKEEGIKLNRGDRDRIDTTSSRIVYDRAKKLDSLCKDSTPIWRQRAVDSLLYIREQEILRQTQPMPVQ